MERCAVQGFPAVQLVGMTMTGVLRATGNAMSTPAVASASKRCMEVLVASLCTDVPRVVPQRDEERERLRVASKLMREYIVLLEAQEAVPRLSSGQG